MDEGSLTRFKNGGPNLVASKITGAEAHRFYASLTTSTVHIARLVRTELTVRAHCESSQKGWEPHSDLEETVTL